MKKIKKNSIRCNYCGDIIVSVHRNDFKWCSCKSVAVDGGTEYLRRSYRNLPEDFTELSEYEEVEDIPALDLKYDSETGLPVDKSYLECNLPKYLRESVENMKGAWEKKKSGEKYLHFDADYCTLQSDINCAEVSNAISSEQAWYLREKYLGLEKGRNTF